MEVFDKKKEFAFVNNANVATTNNVREFINSGVADRKRGKKAVYELIRVFKAKDFGVKCYYSNSSIFESLAFL